MKFLFRAIVVLVFLGLVITPSISESLAFKWQDPLKNPKSTKSGSPLTPTKFPHSQGQPKILVTWGYSYFPCPTIFGCEVYVDSFKIIPYKTGQYQKTHLISQKCDSIKPFYILIGSFAGVYSGTRITTIGKFSIGPYDDRVYTWKFTAGKDGAFERADGQIASLKNVAKNKATISMALTYNGFQPLK